MQIRPREPRVKDGNHLDFVRSLPCVCCQDNTTTEAAHVRFGDSRAAKRHLGKGEKPDDSFAVPLCGGHHRMQHEISERRFWDEAGIDPIFVALALHRVSGNYHAGLQIIANARISHPPG